MRESVRLFLCSLSGILDLPVTFVNPMGPFRITLFKTEDCAERKNLHPNRLGCTPGPLGLNRAHPLTDSKDAPPGSGPEGNRDET